MTTSTELNNYFVYTCKKGLEAKGLADKLEYQERLQFEIDTVLRMGFPGYFLIVRDFVQWARNNNIFVGPGRGSAAGSLLSYCLGITGLDPVKYGLLFERFLNPGRISMPDIDIDLETTGRSKVIQYLIDKYGADRVAQIGTFGVMRAKAAVKSVARTLGHPHSIGDEISKLLLLPIHGKHVPLQTSIKTVKQLWAWRSSSGTYGEILRWAEKIENHIANVGVHASGVVISNKSLLDTVPLFYGKSKEVATQWEMNDIEDIGLIKFDILALDTLDKMHTCIRLIKEYHNIDIDINNISPDDDNVFTTLRSGSNIGMFQLETSSGMRDMLVAIRPKNLEDIGALVAIYRPGPLGSDYKKTYLAVRAGQMEPNYLIPELEPILKSTNGWLIYQEDCMKIAKELCGYSPSEADDLRKAIGKKLSDKMAEHEKKFIQGWINNGYPEALGRTQWEALVKFSDYGFNKSHALAYGFITYQTAYLKTYYPTEFMCAIMMTDAGNKDQMIKYLSECKHMGIEVLPPDINHSQSNFSVEGPERIRFGLGPIKNLGEGANVIINERLTNGTFKSLRDFCQRIDLGQVHRIKLETLIRAGAFNSYGYTRAALLEAVNLIWQYREEEKKYQSKLLTYNKKQVAYEERLRQIEQGTNKKLKPLKEPEKLVAPVWPDIPDLDEIPIAQIQSDEHELLGLYLSSHPLDWTSSGKLGARYNTIADIKEFPDKTYVSIAAVVTSNKELVTKAKKQKMSFAVLEDLTGTIEAISFPKSYSQYEHLLTIVQPLRINGHLQVTESDESRVSKIVIQKVTLLHNHSVQDNFIHVNVPITCVKDLANLLQKFAGDAVTVQINLSLVDGTLMRVPDVYKISANKEAFKRELNTLLQ